MKKIDFKTELMHLYNSSGKQVIKAYVTPIYFLIIDGNGNSKTSPEFQHVIKSLSSLSYLLKFAIYKQNTRSDSIVIPLEFFGWPHKIYLSTPRHDVSERLKRVTRKLMKSKGRLNGN
ncbi:MAG: hypothetical protein HN915_02045 [Candidatus Marinimicrobia bacterium]|jgi:hypothetical protein|nr:hypothetical protein [Candidatus Neomarinimicrobiota bacterium]MBT5175118.1 hypothetical protein [Candidatus Neomarinimicrobiota bacterium]MBT6128599.1 hypothetical protein [Candidatus Neomarinimicrobiota bacterium]MBT6636569.1 hypothetical protein [Candidatus Neomarinimicrobiota bacterium]MBT7194169.1 hypothetical protein [Candidatus Neomarinimicrobiota bacterium]